MRFGYRVPSLAEIAVHGRFLDLWKRQWPQQLTAEVVLWSCDLRDNRSSAGTARGREILQATGEIRRLLRVHLRAAQPLRVPPVVVRLVGLHASSVLVCFCLTALSSVVSF